MATVGLIVDIAIILMVIIFGIIGFKKGFVKSFLSLFSWVVCIGIAIFTAKYVANWLNHIHNFDALIGKGITNGLTKNNPFFSTLAAEYTGVPDGLGILGQLTKVVMGKVDVSAYGETATVASVVGESIGHICMVIISGILVFIVLKLGIFLLSKLFDKITSNKGIGLVNKIFGVIFGVVKAGVFIIILNIICVLLSLVPVLNNHVIKPIIKDNTHIERVIYNQTDKIIEDKVINGDVIQKWLSNIWNKR